MTLHDFHGHWPSEMKLKTLTYTASSEVTTPWASLKQSFHSKNEKQIYTRWIERNNWVFALIKQVFNDDYMIQTSNEAELTYDMYSNEIDAFQTLLNEATTTLHWDQVEKNRPNLIIRKVMNADGVSVFIFPYATGLTSDMDIQFNVDSMSTKQFDNLKKEVLSTCGKFCLSRQFDLNVYIEGDIESYPTLSVEECKVFLKSKLIRFQIIHDMHQEEMNPDLRLVQDIYKNYYEATSKKEDPIKEERDLYIKYFEGWEKFNENRTALNLALFHYLKIEGYVCSASLKFVLKITEKNSNDLYQIAAMENLCDAVIHMSGKKLNIFLDKSKYIKRCALALRSCICEIKKSCDSDVYSCRLRVLKSIVDIADSYDKLRQSASTSDKSILQSIQSDGPFFISTCASVIQNTFKYFQIQNIKHTLPSRVSNSYAELKTTLLEILDYPNV